jgi:acyl-[acyl-carrier-protein]-phospholipid O-acyltransferase/long-chain-fatty-acid--[acyl-carrier-protein] ligase
VAHSQFALLRSRHFLPLFATQFLGALNDNLLKSALVMLITYRVAGAAGANAEILVAAAGGVFILPFFLFSATAGQLADRCDKAWLIRWVKLAEIAIMAGAAGGFLLGSIPLLFFVLFLMGAHSTFFGPLKYGILPDHLPEGDLLGANALVESGTFLGILVGTIVGGLLVLQDGGAGWISTLVVAVAVAGWAVSLAIPPTQPAAPELKVRLNVLRETWDILAYSARDRAIFLIILGISWYWLVGATILSQIPTLARDVIGADEGVVTLFLTLFSIGVAVGSLLCNRLQKGAVHATYVPLGAVGITAFALDLFLATRHHAPPSGSLLDVAGFLAGAGGWRIVVDLVGLAVAGGLFIVPLYALLQRHSAPAHRARNVAANNVVNALFMVVSALATALLLGAGLGVPEIFLTLALVNAAVAVYITRLLPGALARGFLAWLLDMLYRVEVRGIDNYERAGNRVVLVANHQSFLDAALIAAYVPDALTFAVNTQVARHPLLRFFLALAKTYPLDPTNPLSVRGLIDASRRGERVVIFPEGRITVTGALMKVYEGPGMVADKAGAKLLPVRLEGAQYTPFSRLKGKVRLRWFPRITVRFLEPRRFAVPEGLAGRRRRQYVGRQLYDVMTGMIFDSSRTDQTLFESLIDAVQVHGRRHPVLEDIERRPIGYGRLLTGSFALGRAIARDTAPGEIVGLLLPNSVGAAVTFFALQSRGRVPAMLNFSAGSRNVVSACRAAGVRRVYSSRRFLDLGRLEDVAAAIESAGIRLVCLEDVRAGLSLADRLLGLAAARLPGIAYRLTHRARDPAAPAAVLFTSGSEGTPKGVVLSHRNLQANRHQVSARIDFGPTDIVFNALPVFHSFGLTCGTLLPLLSGVKVFLYPSPLHYRIVPELAYDTNATIMFGTDTFLSGYARFAHPYDFYSMRYVFAGAERLRDETRRAWSERFGVRILEGYGATETSPVLSINTPMENRTGTVGRLVPGIRHRLEPVPGIEGAGRLMVAGPNVMTGYLRAQRPGVVEPPAAGWYDTGDIVSIDVEGYLTIRGRLKRFAKVGGEMVSLGAVEEHVTRLWPGHGHAAVALSDPRKGEQVVLVTERAGAQREELGAFWQREGIAEISMPRTIVPVDALPLLGSGKVDYVAVNRLAEAARGG